MKLAVSLGHGIAPSEAVDAAIKLELFGYDFLWVSESVGFDSLALLGAIAKQTKRIGLGTGVVNVYSRSATQLAMAAATVDELSAGRFVLGIGASSAEVVKEWHDIEFTAQVAQMNEYVEVLKAKLRKENPKLPIPFSSIRQDIPIFFAGVGERMLELAKRKADGVLFFMRPLSSIETKSQQLAAPSFRVCANVVTCVSHDHQRGEAQARKTVAFYLSHGGAYGRFMERLNPEGPVRDALAAVRSDWLKGRKEDAARRVPEAVLREVSIFGTPAECRRAIEEYSRIRGLDTLGLQFNSGEPSLGESLELYSSLLDTRSSES